MEKSKEQKVTHTPQEEARYSENPPCGYCRTPLLQGQPVEFYKMKDGVNRPLHSPCKEEYVNPAKAVKDITDKIAKASERIGTGEGELNADFGWTRPLIMGSILPVAGILAMNREQAIVSCDEKHRPSTLLFGSILMADGASVLYGISLLAQHYYNDNPERALAAGILAAAAIAYKTIAGAIRYRSQTKEITAVVQQLKTERETHQTKLEQLVNLQQDL